MISNAVVTAVRQVGFEDEWSGASSTTVRWTGQHRAYYTEEVRSASGQSAAGGSQDVARVRRELLLQGGLPVKPAVGDTVEFVHDSITRTGKVEAVAGPRGTSDLPTRARTTKVLLGDE